MKTALKLFIFLVPVIALTGCAEMLQASQEARDTLNKVMGYGGTTESVTSSQSAPVNNNSPSKVYTPSEVCNAYRENSYKAETFFPGKILTAKGVVYSTSLYGVTFKNKRTLISKMTPRDNEKVKKGQTYSATGKIYQIDFGGTDFDCEIILM